MKLTAKIDPYQTEHTDNLTSRRIQLTDTENQALHDHYDNAIDYLLNYWVNNYQLHPKYADIELFLDSNLHYRPRKVKGQKQLSKEIRRLTHHKDQRPVLGKYYTHRQILMMLQNKAQSTMKHDNKQLQHWTESIYRRFNAYISWVQEWDAKYNEGKCIGELDRLRVRITWQKLN